MKSKHLLHQSAAEHNLTHILKRASSPPRKKSVGGGRGKGRFQQPVDKPKTRKELRKETRKNKKATKHKYILNKFGKTPDTGEKPGKKKRVRKNRKRNRNNNKKMAEAADENNQGQDNDGDGDQTGKYVRALPKVTNKGDKPGPSARAASEREEDDKELEQLKKEMMTTRKRRILEENAEEDKFISQMEKRLKLNKKAKIPASFRTDGLDYLLELCQSSRKKTKKEDDEKLDKISKSMGKAEELDDDDEDESVDNDEDSEESMDDLEDDHDISGDEEIGEEDEQERSDADEDDSDDEVLSDIPEGSDDSDLGDDTEDSDLDKSENEGSLDNGEESPKPKKKKKKTKDEGLWEDIYGRMRRKDGSVVDVKLNPTEITTNVSKSDPVKTADKPVTVVPTGKYVPPNQRGKFTQKDRISRSLKGLLNRMSEANMNSISKQIEELYMENSRNEINECMLELLNVALVRTVAIPDRVILEHVMLIAILHANIGTEIGAFFLQKFVDNFKTKYDSTDTEIDDSKELENLLLLISSMYHFKVVDSGLLYDILKLLASNFKPIDVELILACLRSIGFRLRKDDPIELKALIILIQQKATASKTSTTNSAKVKFMLEVVTAIRNNNMTKIPNYDPSVGDHLAKNLKSHIHKGNYVSTMKIKLEDLLNAETKGRWWIVGSAWSNIGDAEKDTKSVDAATFSKDKQQNEKLMSKARALGMNTETRKTVFFILMTAEDYVDAFNKLNQLDLKHNQEREIIHVTTYCCIHEKKFNPYYGFVASKFCTLDRKHMLTLQYNLWDRLKDLDKLESYQLINLAKLLVHLINDKSLALSSLKVIEYAEMDKTKLKFLKEVLCGILLQKDDDNMQEIFLKTAASENLMLFRESLRLFMGHFLLQENVITSDGENVGCDLDEETMETLKERISLAESAMALGRGRVQL